MFLKVVIYRNVAFTHSNTQKDIYNRAKMKTCHLSGYWPLSVKVYVAKINQHNSSKLEAANKQIVICIT